MYALRGVVGRGSGRERERERASSADVSLKECGPIERTTCSRSSSQLRTLRYITYSGRPDLCYVIT